MLRIFIALVLVLFATSAFAWTHGASVAAWQTLKVGGGGYVTGLQIASDGTRLERTDVYGAYYYNPNVTCGNNSNVGCWQQIINASNMSDSTCSATQCGTYEVAIAPTNTSHWYMIFDGYVWSCTSCKPAPATWTQTPLAQDTSALSNPNDDSRLRGDKMAVDPNNENVVVVSTPTAGLHYSTNGGSTWTAIPTSSIPAATNGANTPYYSIAFDPSSGTGGSPTQTQGVYIFSSGHGMYHTSTGLGGTWAETSTTNMPTTLSHMVVGQDGILYAGDGSINNVYTLASGSWTSASPGGGDSNGLWSIIIDPAHPTGASKRLVAVLISGSISISNDGGSTWSESDHFGSSGYTPITTTAANDIPWLAGLAGNFLALGEAQFDPSQSNMVVAGTGVGTFYVSNMPAAGTPITTPTNSIVWTSQTAANEELVATMVVSPNGVPLVSVLDRNTFYLSNLAQYPSPSQQQYNGFAAGWGIDYAGTNTQIVCSLAYWEGTAESGCSSNGGSTWVNFTDDPLAGESVGNGAIAVSSANDILVARRGGVAPVYTLNGGSTAWTSIFISGVTWGTFLTQEFDISRPLCADKTVSTGTYYLWHSGFGLYESTNAGAAWTQVNTLTASTGDFSELQCTPGQANDIWLTPGNGNTSWSFYHASSCTTSSCTLTAISGVSDVYRFGFGAACPGHTYPAVYIVGTVSAISANSGIYRTCDQGTTWTALPFPPLNTRDYVTTISGDMSIYGRVYVGFTGSGFAYGQFNYLLNRDLDPAVNDDRPAFMDEAA